MLAEGLTVAVHEQLSRAQQDALTVQLMFNRGLAYALVGVGFVGGISVESSSKPGSNPATEEGQETVIG